MLLSAEPKGSPPPSDSSAPVVLETRGLKVWFPIRRGFFRKTVGHIKAVDGLDARLAEAVRADAAAILAVILRALGLGAVTRPLINLVVSNVGGIDGSRYLGESRLSAAYPVSMVADPAGLNVTVVSLDDHMDFGIVANAAVIADAFELSRACQASFAQLARAVQRTPAAKSKPRRPRDSRLRP